MQRQRRSVWLLSQSLAEKPNHLVDRRTSRLTGRVDKVTREDRMRRFSLGLEACGIARAVGQFGPGERVAEGPAQGCEPWRLAQFIAFETITAQLQSLARSRHDLLQIIRRDIKCGRRQCGGAGLGENRSQHDRLDGHRKRKSTCDAHTDGADSRPAAL